MKPTEIDSRRDAEEAARWKAIRVDTFDDVTQKGQILVWANEGTGSYAVRHPDGAVTEHKLECGLRIVPRK